MKKKNTNMQSFLKDSFIYIPSKIIEGIMGIVGLIYYTRWFVPEEYGEFSLIATGIGLSTTFLMGWLSQSSLRYYGNNQKNEDFVSTVIILILGINLAFIIFSIILMYYIPLVHKYYLYIVVLFIVSGMWAVLQSMLRAARKAYVYSVTVSFTQILKFGFTLTLVKWLNIGVESLLISTIVFDFILVLISLRYLNIKKYFKFKISKRILKEIFTYGFPLVGVALISWILQSSDRIMLGWLKDTEQVGMYTIGYTIVGQPFKLILTSIMISAFPVLIKVWGNQGKREAEETLTGILRYFFMLIIPAIIGLTLLKETIFKQLVGPEYYEANKIIPWVALGLLFMGLTQYTNKVWELTERTKMILKLTAVAGIVNVLLNFIFIPWLGYEGAAITTLIAYLLYFIISTVRGYKYMKLNFNYESLLKVTCASIVMGVFIYYTNSLISSIISLILMIAVYGLVYLIALLIFNEGRRELKVLTKRLKTRIKGG